MWPLMCWWPVFFYQNARKKGILLLKITEKEGENGPRLGFHVKLTASRGLQAQAERTVFFVAYFAFEVIR